MKLSGGAALRVSAFGDRLDDLGGESIEGAGLPRGDHALVDDDWGIFPFCAGVDHVVGGENRHAFAGTKRMRCQARRRTISPPAPSRRGKVEARRLSLGPSRPRAMNNRAQALFRLDARRSSWPRSRPMRGASSWNSMRRPG